MLPGLPQGSRRHRKKLKEAARLLAGGQLYLGAQDEPTASNSVADAMAALGIYCEEPVVIDDDEFWLWPENDAAFQFWLSVQTQWVVGLAGPEGLNYPGVEVCMRMHRIKKNVQQQLFGSIQMMERAALDEWASKRRK